MRLCIFIELQRKTGLADLDTSRLTNFCRRSQSYSRNPRKVITARKNSHKSQCLFRKLSWSHPAAQLTYPGSYGNQNTRSGKIQFKNHLQRNKEKDMFTQTKTLQKRGPLSHFIPYLKDPSTS